MGIKYVRFYIYTTLIGAILLLYLNQFKFPTRQSPDFEVSRNSRVPLIRNAKWEIVSYIEKISESCFFHFDVELFNQSFAFIQSQSSGFVLVGHLKLLLQESKIQLRKCWILIIEEMWNLCGKFHTPMNGASMVKTVHSSFPTSPNFWQNNCKGWWNKVHVRSELRGMLVCAWRVSI